METEERQFFQFIKTSGTGYRVGPLFVLKINLEGQVRENACVRQIFQLMVHSPNRPAQAGSLELISGFPMRVHGSKDLDYPLLFSPAHHQGAGSKVELQGYKCVLLWDATASGLTWYTWYNTSPPHFGF